MIKINLLPPAERPSSFSIIRLAVIGSIFVVVLCSGLFAYNALTIWSLNNQLETTTSRYDILRVVEEKMAQHNAKAEEINKRQVIITKLTQEQKDWSSLLTHLTAITPSKVWFTHIGADEKEKTKKGLIKISGVAATYPDLASFMQQLSQDQIITNPVLAGVTRDPNPASLLIRFEITVQLKEKQ